MCMNERKRQASTDEIGLTRRQFVVAVAVLSGAAGVALDPRLLSLSQAWAESSGTSDEKVHAEMLRMARLLYPHDALPDAVYARVLDRALSAVAVGAAFAGQLNQAAAALDGTAGGAWQDLDAAAQVEAMRGIETEAFFVTIRDTVRAGIYNSPEFWQHVGYPGPSKGFGGYLHRGAGDIDWLPGKR
jgi:hypothetical protein